MWNSAGLGRALFVLLLGAAGAQGCGDSDDDPQTGATGARPPIMGSGGSNRGGNGGRAGNAGEGGTDNPSEGGAAGVPMQQPGGPLVRVLSPKAVEEPSDGGVLVEDEVEVLCEVRKSETADAQDVEPSSVMVQLLDADGAQLDSVMASATSVSDQFSANLIVPTSTENGRLRIVCGAADRSTPPLVSLHQIDTFIDRGPRIEPSTPKPDAAIALGAAQFRFSVRPDPVAKTDPESAVDEVSLEVSGVRISDLEDDGDGEYVATVDFEDRDLFGSPPTGTIPVTIRATNRREPEAVERILSYSVVIDSEGPDIEIRSPAGEDVIGRQLEVVFTVSDALSEVDVNSLVVNLSGENYRFGDDGTWRRDGDTFTVNLDATEAAELSGFQVSIRVSATDTAGNQTLDTVVTYIDTTPAIVDLDPPNVREFKEDPLRCSMSFDPIGAWPPEDLDTVGRLVVFRALVWEMANTISATEIYKSQSATQEGSVEVYLQWDSAEALVRDTNGDGTCDDLRDGYKSRLPGLPLNPINPTGAAWYGADDPSDPRNVAPPSDCPLQDEAAPDKLCLDEASDMRRVIAHRAYVAAADNTRPPVVFAFGNLAPNSLTCTGIEVDLITQSTDDSQPDEGWLCVAAVSDDNAGNRGVSKPLRLCFDNPAVAGSPACADDKSNPPSCDDGCTPPPSFPSGERIEN
jgi:hypothetical protein